MWRSSCLRWPELKSFVPSTSTTSVTSSLLCHLAVTLQLKSTITSKAEMPPKRKAAVSKEPAKKENDTKRSKVESSEKENGDGEEHAENVIPTSNSFDSIKAVKKAPNGGTCNLKIISWNVNGLRAVVRNGAFENYLRNENADIICLQETKCPKKDVPDQLAEWKEYPFKYYCDSKKASYAGVALFSKKKPLSVTYGLSVAEHDIEGRLITATFEDFILINAYVPNAGRELVRLPYRIEQWDEDLRKHLATLDSIKPVILCGDLNVSHKEIDLANPNTNKKTAGFTPQERASFTKLLEGGFIDSFRFLYPNLRDQYTFWSYMKNARAKNVGWRLDYFVLSSRLQEALCDNQIRSSVMGSDHCPIVLYLAPIQQ